MEALEVGMVDIAELIATCRAARELRAHAMSAHLRAHWHHLCTELKRATLAYADVLARAGHDDAVDRVAACRAAAEQEMPGVIALRHELRVVVQRRCLVLDAAILVRDDLSRLSCLAAYMREGGAALSRSTTNRYRRHVKKATRYVQQRLRWAVCAYARASVRGADPGAIAKARLAATGQLDRPCIETVCGLARLEGDGGAGMSLIHRNVARPLRHLRKDWKDAAAI